MKQTNIKVNDYFIEYTNPNQIVRNINILREVYRHFHTTCPNDEFPVIGDDISPILFDDMGSLWFACEGTFGEDEYIIRIFDDESVVYPNPGIDVEFYKYQRGKTVTIVPTDEERVKWQASEENETNEEEAAIDNLTYDMRYEPTFNAEDGSM